MISDFLRIDGQNMPEPGEFSIKSSDLDGENTGRLENGNMQRDVIWFGARTPSAKWNAIPQAESQLLLSAIKKAEFQLSYIDPEHGRVTKTCYAGPFTVDYVPKSQNRVGGPWWNISFDVIESKR